jgi:2-amino-4-hydroxy-6-hydroxymethyldihydropteridine diphosphokinase
MLNLIYLSLGSNVGDRQKNLREAIERIGQISRVTTVSSIYETEPVELTDQPEFLNCAVGVEASVRPAEFMQEVLEIEKAMGRKRIQQKGPRIIDIDILLFGDAVVDAPDLKIPHPAMHKRRFVLEPLTEIAPEIRHPVLKKTIQELLADLPVGQMVKKLKT